MSDISTVVSSGFAPSELVVLFGDRFVKEAGLLGTKEEILTSGVKVDAGDLVKEAVTAALFAVHRAGGARLEPRTGKALFGLMKKSTLHLVPGSGSVAWPEGSLESFLAAAAEHGREVDDVIAAWIGNETYSADQRAVSLVKAGLAGRGLLEAREKKTLKVFTTVEYLLPDATRAAASAVSLDPIRRLLDDAKQREPELEKAVRRAVQLATVRMTKSND